MVTTSLHRLFVFNPNYGGEETADQKILFFHPSEIPIDQQTNSVGLSEALINFTTTFSKDLPCESVHSQKRRQVFYQCEPEFWFVMIVNNPTASSKGSKDSDGQTEYYEEELQDRILVCVLQRMYRIFKMFCGNFTGIVEQKGVDALRTTLQGFMSHCIASMIAQGVLDFDRCDLVDALDGMRFLPVERKLYLSIQYFLNTVTGQFQGIRSACFTYNDHLVWSGVGREDVQLLHRYLLQHLCGGGADSAAQSALPEESDPAMPLLLGASLGAQASSSGTFLAGAVELAKNGTAIRCPLLTLEDEIQQDEPQWGVQWGAHTSSTQADNAAANGQIEHTNAAASTDVAGTSAAAQQAEGRRYRLVVYQLQKAVVALLVEETGPWQDLEWYRRLHGMMAPELRPVAQLLSEQYSRVHSHSDPYRYIYFNHLNLALKTSLKPKGSNSVPTLIRSLLNQMHADLNKAEDNPNKEVKELCTKTNADGWVIARKTGSREFYVIFDQKYANLIEIHEEVAKLSATYFNNIFVE